MIGRGRWLNTIFFLITARTRYSTLNILNIIKIKIRLKINEIRCVPLLTGGFVLCSILIVSSSIENDAFWGWDSITESSALFVELVSETFSRTANGFSSVFSFPFKMWWPIMRILKIISEIDIWLEMRKLEISFFLKFLLVVRICWIEDRQQIVRSNPSDPPPDN